MAEEAAVVLSPPGVITAHTNDHFLADTTKEEKWLVLVGRPSPAAISVGGRGRPPHCTEARPTEIFSYKSALKKANSRRRVRLIRSCSQKTLTIHVILNGA